jgi:hypothetical protein
MRPAEEPERNMGLDAESVIERRRLKRRVTIWRIAAVVLGL